MANTYLFVALLVCTTISCLPMNSNGEDEIFVGPYPKYPSTKEVFEIASVAEDPVRNLAITNGYFRLSRALTYYLGTEEASWPTYATWASNSVGFGIRNETLMTLIELHVRDKGFKHVADLLEKFPYMKFGFYRQLTGHCSKNLALGNRIVFEQVGYAMAGMIEASGYSATPDSTKLDEFLSKLDPESAPVGEQQLIDAVRIYFKARYTKDPVEKSQLIALANALVGWDEQSKLQGALDDTFQPLEMEIAGKKLLIPVAEIMTDSFTLNMPGEYLMVLRDVVPPPNTTTIFPQNLQTITNPRLAALYKGFNTPVDTLQGSHAFDWLSLQNRLKFVFPMMRTRQSDKALWHCFPFTDQQTESIYKYEFPKDKRFCITDCDCNWGKIV